MSMQVESMCDLGAGLSALSSFSSVASCSSLNLDCFDFLNELSVDVDTLSCESDCEENGPSPCGVKTRDNWLDCGYKDVTDRARTILTASSSECDSVSEEVPYRQATVAGSHCVESSRSCSHYNSIHNSATPTLEAVPTAVVDIGGNITTLLPLNSLDKQRFIALANSGLSISVPIKVQYGIHSMDETAAGKTKPAMAVETTQSYQAPPKLAPKHVYKTQSGTYRVRISKHSETSASGIFSRNVRSQMDALWLCECVLMLIDKPNKLATLIRNGNYDYLVQESIVISEEDYSAKLVFHFNDLVDRRILTVAESESIREVFCGMPTVSLLPSVSSLHTGNANSNIQEQEQEMEKRKQSFLEKAKNSFSEMTSLFTGLQRRKRRRMTTSTKF